VLSPSGSLVTLVAVATAVAATSLVWHRVMRRQIRALLKERERLEVGLRQAQKMEAVGRLAGGIAHDFNNLLTVVIGYCEALASSIPPGDADGQHAVREIRAAADRATSLTRQLLAFGRRQMLAPVVVDLNDVVREMARMLERVLGGDVTLVLAVSREPVRVVVDRNQMEQAILNLAVNSRDAMPDGGRLTMSTARERTEGDGSEIRAGDYGVLTVADTGSGMSAEVQKHIFDPFFSTKEIGQGSGLGLSMVYGFVKQSGGHVRVRSAPNEGAAFDLAFPLA
jgi:signal transduction histidine kinase